MKWQKIELWRQEMTTLLSDTITVTALRVNDVLVKIPNPESIHETRQKINEIIAYLNNNESKLKPIPQKKIINFYKNRIKRLEKELKALKESKGKEV